MGGSGRRSAKKGYRSGWSPSPGIMNPPSGPKRCFGLGPATEPRKQSGLSVKEEIARINKALGDVDEDVLGEYGGFNEALQRSAKLQDLPEAQATDGVSINGFATWRASRFAVVENGFADSAEDS